MNTVSADRKRQFRSRAPCSPPRNFAAVMSARRLSKGNNRDFYSSTIRKAQVKMRCSVKNVENLLGISTLKSIASSFESVFPRLKELEHYHRPMHIDRPGKQNGREKEPHS